MYSLLVLRIALRRRLQRHGQGWGCWAISVRKREKMGQHDLDWRIFIDQAESAVDADDKGNSHFTHAHT